MPGASRFFISYRRQDTAGHAGRLYDRLAERFGDVQVFVDIGALVPGEDFVARVENTIASVDAVLVLIGRQWLTALDSTGRRRLDDPRDLVRLEAATALQTGRTTIPLLFDGVAFPPENELPTDLRPLARRNALEFPRDDWERGFQLLVRTLADLLARTQSHQSQARSDLGFDAWSDLRARAQRHGLDPARWDAELRKLLEILSDEEIVALDVAVAPEISSSSGLLVLTYRRLLFLHPGRLSRTKVTQFHFLAAEQLMFKGANGVVVEAEAWAERKKIGMLLTKTRQSNYLRLHGPTQSDLFTVRSAEGAEQMADYINAHRR